MGVGRLVGGSGHGNIQSSLTSCQEAAQPSPLSWGRDRAPPGNPRAYSQASEWGGKTPHTWAGQAGERLLTLFFSNFQFSSWAKIWSTTAMASFPWWMYSHSWSGRGGGGVSRGLVPHLARGWFFP